MTSTQIQALHDRLEDLERDLERVSVVPGQVAELRGRLDTIQQTQQTLLTLVNARFDKVDMDVERSAGLKTALTFVSVAIMPVLLALIGGYFALKAGLSQP